MTEATTPKRGWSRLRHSTVEGIHRIGPTAFAVYCALLRHADRAGYCFPGQDRLARLVGVSTRTIGRSLKTLEWAGLIRVERKRGRPNRYRLSPEGTADTSVVTAARPQTPVSAPSDTAVVTTPDNHVTRTRTKANKNQGKRTKGVDHLRLPRWDECAEAVKARCNWLCDVVRPNTSDRDQSRADRALLLKVGCLLEAGAIPEAAAVGAREAVKHRNGSDGLRNPVAYFRRVLDDELGGGLADLLAAVDCIPAEAIEPKRRGRSTEARGPGAGGRGR
jgi:DNA-binding MarR family transcriptional regulator